MEHRSVWVNLDGALERGRRFEGFVNFRVRHTEVVVDCGVGFFNIGSVGEELGVEVD